MKEKNLKIVAFATLAGGAINAICMSHGIETMPGMWVSEVYKNPMLATSIGGITGMSLGGAAGFAAVAAKETIVHGIDAIRNKFLQPKEDNALRLKM